MEVENTMDDSKEQGFKARPYQNQILDIALRQNVIIFLPTGSGKTYIAIMAMKEMSRALEKPLDEGGKRSVFLTNTVALARQQFDCMQILTNFKPKLYTGDMNVDNWKREKWRQEFDECQVVVATAQIILDVIRHGFLLITDFNLMIFDECHHAVNDHPMNQLMGHFQNANSARLPRVIGLTGLLLKQASPDNIEQNLNKMEAIFRSSIVTVSNADDYENVLAFSTKPTENVIIYHQSTPTETIYSRIKELVAECIQTVQSFHIDLTTLATKNLGGERIANPIKKAVNLWNDFLQKLDDMGIYGASIGILSFLVEFELKKRSAETSSIRNMTRMCISYAERIRHEIVSYMKAGGDEIGDGDGEEYSIHEMITDNSTRKIQSFLSFLVSNFTGKNMKDISCLVFVERRQTAKCLYYVVKHFLESQKTIPIVPEFMVGQAGKALPDSIETWLEAKRQRNVLKKFKRGDCNMVIASSVLEEGIDIQSCNYVIMYDNIKHFGSYVQTKGRARMQNSFYIIMLEYKMSQKIIKNVGQYKLMEDKLKEYLMCKSIDRPLPLQEDIDEQFQVDIKPFYTPSGAMLEAGSVLALLNRYCMTLPQDSFTSTTVQWSKKVLDNKKLIVSLVMPPQSTIKEDIMSDPMPSTKLAKRSAAFKACVKLYENKELNEHLLPVSKANCFELVDDIYFKHWRDFKSDIARLAGTTKNIRHHNIHYPHQLCGATPQTGVVAYMYVIDLTPQFAETATLTEVMTKLLTTQATYAILSSKELPQLSKMPLFLSQGQVTVAIDPKPVTVQIKSSADLQLLRKFHTMLFRELLETWSQFMANDYENRQNSFLIVPTNNDRTIDWDLVRSFQVLPKCHQLNEIQRSKLTFNPAAYENAIICPWYSADQKTRYVVTQVLTHMTPFDPFPNGMHKSYADYANNKYSVNVMVKDQFMLQVVALTSRRNFIHPGDGTGGSKKSNRRLDDIKLIPELCHNFRFPGNMWLKATFIPNILHRVHYILIAENLRIQINQFVGIDSANHVPETLPVEWKKNPEKEELDDSMTGLEIETHIADGFNKIVIEKDEAITEPGHCEEFKEPIDIDRKLDELYEIELDYYVQFISDDFAKLKLNEKDSAPSPVKIAKLTAICDNPDRAKDHINLLRNVSNINQSELLVALTRASANDVFNMERLELLGDSFLKLSASLYLLQRHKDWNEGLLTALKGRLVSNRNLFYHSTRLNLAGMLNIDKFDPRHEWAPPLAAIPVKVRQAIESNGISMNVLWKLELNDDEVEMGDVRKEHFYEFTQRFPDEDCNQESTLMGMFGRRRVSDKCCSDGMEAILGVCVKNWGVDRSFAMLKFFGICPNDYDVLNLMKAPINSPRLRNGIPNTEIDALLFNYQELEKTLGYKFNDRAYLLQALTHPSYLSNRLTNCYQTLEFLGDAVLDFLISSYIFERCDYMGPGELTDLRSALVNNTFLACLTVRNKFHSYMLSQSAVLMQAVERFVRFQEAERNQITDQVRILIQEEECSMADYIEVPKALGDIFEALVGAVFLDTNRNLEKTFSVIYNLMSNEIEQYIQNVPKQLVRLLMESKFAEAKFSDPVVDEETVMVVCMFNCRGKWCEVNGFGKNKESAKISAAKLALQALQK